MLRFVNILQNLSGYHRGFRGQASTITMKLESVSSLNWSRVAGNAFY